MSEPLLKAILKLFVIVAKEDDIIESEREKVLDFLNQHLNSRKVDHWLNYFDKLGAEAVGSKENTEESEMQELLTYCKRINVELTKKQKTVLIKELIELILADGTISEKEDNLVKTIASSTNVEDEDVNKFRELITINDTTDSNSFLIASSTKGKKGNNKIIRDFPGILYFMYSSSSDSYFVKYMGSGEQYLNNRLIVSGRIEIFPTGSSIRSQNLDPIYYSDIVSHFHENDEQNHVSFDATGVYYKFPNGNIGLRDININEKSGKLISLMGASGAGKSTLLHVLNGSEAPSEGKVLISGINIHTNKSNIEGVIGFVPQDDLLIEDLSVFQNLYYAGKLCFGDITEQELVSLVNDTLQNLGLFEIKDLKVGSPLEKTISGGQRKRVNIGLELLREPSVLFVDEPTSGLSSRDSENIMDLLKELSLKGKLVFVVIHQPSSEIFKMFDKLIILDVGGYQIYYGDPVDAVVYFKDVINLINKEESQCIKCGNVNPEQIFNIIETRVVDEYGRTTKTRKILPEQWHKKFEDLQKPSAPARFSSAPPTSMKIPGFLEQFRVFLVRDLLSKLSNRQYMIINFIEAPLLALLLAFIVRYYSGDENISEGYLFSKNVNIPSYIFMSIIVALFMGLTVSAEEIFKDRKILKREAFLNLSRSSYLFSKVTLLLTLSALQTLLFVLIGNTILEIQGMYFSYWAIFFSCAFFANMLGLNISSAFNSAVTIYILIPILLIPQLLLSGVVVEFDKLNPKLSNEARVPLVGDIMASRWAMEAAMVTQFKDNDYESMFFDIDKQSSDADYKRLYMIPNLNSKLDYCSNHFGSSDEEIKKTIRYNLQVLRRELENESRIVGKDKFPEIEQLTEAEFDRETLLATRNFIRALNKFYISKNNDAIKKKESIIQVLNETPEKSKAFRELRANNKNESVAALVKNVTEQHRIVEVEGKLIRKLSPIYITPIDYRHLLDFRTQFYTFEKYFLGAYFPTFWFNISMIWFMSFVLFLMLYFDILRRIINYKFR